jgi:hypothetical protein
MNNITIILLSFVIGYGLSYGISNTLTRLKAWIADKRFCQDWLGTVLDVIWYSVISFLILSKFFAG